VVHEFGHALGCIHEHQSPDENLQWNKDAVYSYFTGSPNFWTKPEIDSNVLQRYSPEGMAFTRFDRQSIMLYMFPAELFLDHVGTPNNTDLSNGDKQFIAQCYPKPASAAPAPATSAGHTATTALLGKLPAWDGIRTDGRAYQEMLAVSERLPSWVL
jgi:hypothetical protein